MEITSGDDTSDKDKKMKGAFEAIDDKKDEKKKPVPKKNLSISSILSGDDKESTPKPSKEPEKFSLIEMLQSYDKDSKDKEKDVDKSKDESSAPHEAVEISSTPETEATDTDRLTGEEETEVVQTYVEAVLPEAHSEFEQSEPDSVEAAEAAASVAFLEGIHDQLGESNGIDDSEVAAIASSIIEELDHQDGGNTEAIEDLADEVESEESLDIEETGIESGPSDHEDVDDDEGVTNSNNSASSNPPTSPPTNVPTTGHPGSGGAMPPVPPTGGGLPPHIPPVGPNSSSTMPMTPNTSPNAASANPNVEFAYNRRRAGDLLLGGIIGYMIGRRRGRIKTEKELIPVQKKLEKQVATLQKRIYSKELEVRKAAARSFEAGHIISEKPPETLEKTATKRAETAPKPEKDTANHDPKEVITSDRLVSNEKTAKEKLVPIINPEKGAINPEKLVSAKTIEAISLPLLLEIASDIKLDNTSLRAMFENGAIDQKNLRFVVKRYLEGESLDRIWPDALAAERLSSETKTEKRNEQMLSEDYHWTENNNTDTHSSIMGSNGHQDNSFTNNQDHKASPGILQEIENQYSDNKKPIYAIVATAILAAIIIIVIFT